MKQRVGHCFKKNLAPVCLSRSTTLALSANKALDVTERSAYAIVNDLTGAGYVLKEREGRRNRYIVQKHLPLPETTVRERTIGEVLDLLVGTNGLRRTTTAEAPANLSPRPPRAATPS